MSFGWGDYFQLAQALFDDSSRFGNQLEEAVLRTAISRAYYSAYHHAVDIAVERDNFRAEITEQAHQRLILHFMYSTDEDYKQIGNDLDRLRKERNRADYDEPIKRPSSMATHALLVARFIIEKLDSLPPKA
jgi:uncharacterized protein (UPF0332 family)